MHLFGIDSFVQNLSKHCFVELYHSASLMPSDNLAYEKFLLQRCIADVKHTKEKPPAIVFFYTNRESVICGVNQNPFQEMHLVFLKEHSIPFFRRISGGGTVYQDTGNLNYSFIFPDIGYKKKAIGHCFQEYFAHQYELNILVGEKEDLFYDKQAPKKFSGTASFLEHKRFNPTNTTQNYRIFHGTLLVSSHLEILRKSLQGDPLVKNSKSVLSRRASVGNLNSVIPINKQALEEDLIQSFENFFSTQAQRVIKTHFEQEEVQKIKVELESFSFLWEKTPFFEYHLPLPFGKAMLIFHVRGATVESICEEGLSLKEKKFLQNNFQGQIFSYSLLQNIIEILV